MLKYRNWKKNWTTQKNGKYQQNSKFKQNSLFLKFVFKLKSLETSNKKNSEIVSQKNNLLSQKDVEFNSLKEQLNENINKLKVCKYSSILLIY